MGPGGTCELELERRHPPAHPPWPFFEITPRTRNPIVNARWASGSKWQKMSENVNSCKTRMRAFQPNPSDHFVKKGLKKLSF